ncbi:Cullin family protein [Clavispora lusitaniae]|nr:Cullin family protein [Clavispora lusitaniae]
MHRFFCIHWLRFTAIHMTSTPYPDFEDSPRLDEDTISHLRSGSPNYPSSSQVNKSRKKLRSERVLGGDDMKTKLDAVRSDVHNIIISVLNNEPVSRSFSSIYKSVELLSIYKHSEQAHLADFVFNAIQERLVSEVVPEVQATFESLTNVDESYCDCITSFNKCVESWTKCLELLEQLLLFMNRSYLLHHPKKHTILEFGIIQFSLQIIYNEDSLIRKKIVILLRKIHILSRSTNVDDIRDLNELANSFVGTIARLDFKGEILGGSGLEKILLPNYKQLKSTWIEEGNDYLRVALDALSAESSFLIGCGLSEQVVMNILKKLKWELIFQDFSQVLDISLTYMIQPQNIEYLKTLWNLCQSSMDDYAVDSCRTFVYAWGCFVRNDIESTIRESKLKNSSLIPELVASFDNLNKLATECLNDDAIGFESRNAQSKALANKDYNNYVLLQLSKYCDNFFKQSRKTKDVNSFAQFEKEVVTVFKLITYKADFMLIYERDLSKRMLLGRSFNLALERKLSEAILGVVGEGDEGSNLRAMFRDVETSRSLYNPTPIDCLPGVEFNAMVLEKKFWPEIPGSGCDIALPNILSQALGEFSCKYEEQGEKHKFHKLDWTNFSLHQIVLLVEFDSGQKELSINLLQASVLMLFEDVDEIHYNELKMRTKMEERQLKKVLSSFTTERCPILILRGDVVIFNRSAELKNARTRVPMTREREIDATDDFSKVIEKNRDPEVRAALVRTMKQSKSILYAELLANVLHTMEQRGTSLSVHTVKEGIEYLISNEYIRRDADGVTLVYVP